MRKLFNVGVNNNLWFIAFIYFKLEKHKTY